MFLKVKRGLWIVFVFNLLIGLLVFGSGFMYSKAVVESPVFVETVSDLPDLIVENKTIVKPTDLKMRFFVQISPTHVIPVYVQTDRDYVGELAVPDGLHITRKAFSLVLNGQLLAQDELSEISKTGVISGQTISKFLYRSCVLFFGVLAVLVMIFLWVFYLVLVGLAALVSLIPALHKNLSKGDVWRNVMWAYVIILTLNLIGAFWGYTLPGLLFPFFSEGIAIFVLAVIFMGISVWHNKKGTSKKKD